MGLPNPIDVAKASAEVFLGPQVWMVQKGVHVTKATATSGLDTLDNIPDRLTRFLTMPLRIAQMALNIGFWVLNHLEWIFLAGLLVLLLIAASFLRTAWQAAHQRVRSTVQSNRPARDHRRDPAVGSGREANHRQGVLMPDGTLCVQGGVTEARHVCQRSGAGKPFSRGNCRIHRGSKLFEVQA